MARITRVAQKIFALAATNNGVFGSGKLGTKVTTDDVAELQSLSAYDNGWLDAVISPQTLPPLEEMQSTNYINTYQLSYMFQEGIPEWDTDTTYYQYSIVKQPGTYNLYGSLTNTNQGNLLTDLTNWQFLICLQAPIQVSMGFEASPTDRRLVFNGQTIAQTSGGTVNGTVFYPAYAYLWNNVSNTYAPVSGGRGLSAAADFAANKTITIPDLTNMSPMQVGSIVNSAGRNNIGASTVASAGSVLISGTTGATTLDITQIPAHSHGIQGNTGATGTTVESGGGGSPVTLNNTDSAGGGGSHTHSNGTLAGSFTGSATSVVHPVFGVYYYINY